jgi:hypothetical protein
MQPILPALRVDSSEECDASPDESAEEGRNRAHDCWIDVHHSALSPRVRLRFVTRELRLAA